MLVLSNQYPGKTTNPTSAYPQGSGLNSTTPGDGTPFDREWFNDLIGPNQRLLAAAGITPSGNADSAQASDVYDAMVKLFSTPYRNVFGAPVLDLTQLTKWTGGALPWQTVGPTNSGADIVWPALDVLLDGNGASTADAVRVKSFVSLFALTRSAETPQTFSVRMKLPSEVDGDQTSFIFENPILNSNAYATTFMRESTLRLDSQARFQAYWQSTFPTFGGPGPQGPDLQSGTLSLIGYTQKALL